MNGGHERSIGFRFRPEVADLVFLELTSAQGLAILLLVPGLVAGSIAEEDRRGTMLDLLATPLSSVAIVLGKLMARLVHVGVAVGVGLPVVVPLGLLGALDPVIWRLPTRCCFALTLFVSSLWLLVSVIVRSQPLAIPTAYLLVGSWLLLPVWYAPIAGKLGWPFSWLRALDDGILQSHPHEAAMFLWRIPSARLFYPPNLAWAWSGFLKAFPSFVGLQAACSALFLLLAAFYLRRLRLGLGRRRARDLIGSPGRHRRQPDALEGVVRSFTPLSNGGQARGDSARRAAVVPADRASLGCLREWQAGWWDATARLGARGDLNESLRQLNAGIYLLGLVAVAALAASSITGERERGPGRVWRRPSSAAAKSSLPRSSAPFGPCEGCPCPF